MESLQKAREHFKNRGSDTAISRQDIVGYAVLSATCGHFPSLVIQEDRAVLLEWSRIRVEEYDRFLKQRRIALSRLAEEYTQRPVVANSPALR